MNYIMGIIAIVGMAVGSGATLWITKAVKPNVKVECPQAVCNCPPNVQAIEVDKLKNFKGTLKVEQHYHSEVKGDSLFMAQWEETLRKELERVRLARCK